MSAMRRYYRTKIFILLVVLLCIFSLMFIIALLNPEFVFFQIGLKNSVQNSVIAFFSFAGICLVLWDMRKI